MDLAQIMGLLLGLGMIALFRLRDRDAMSEETEDEELEEALMIDDLAELLEDEEEDE